jgi:hypothetical protein
VKDAESKEEPKTRLEWFNTLDEPYRTQAMQAMRRQHKGDYSRRMEMKYKDAFDALVTAFQRDSTEQGNKYWTDLLIELL